MKFDDLKFTEHQIGENKFKMAKEFFDNGFTVSIIKEEDHDYYNGAIVRDGSVVITEIHKNTDIFIIGRDYTFDLINKRKVTTFLKQVEKLSNDSDFCDISFNENGEMVYYGKEKPCSEEILKIIKKITPFSEA